jgi:CHASE2 domain-containing sensor protein
VVLALMLGLQWTSTPVHRALQLALFDACQALWPRERKSAPAVIVAIDEASLARYGQWPWPRAELARLVQAIAKLQPAVIGLDLLFPEPDRHGADHDRRFADALRETRSVLAVAGTSGRGVNARGGFPPARIEGADPLPRLRRFDSLIRSTPVIDRAAAGHGVISADAHDVIIRGLPMAVAIQGAIAPTLGLEMIRIAAGESAVRVRAGTAGVSAVGTGDIAVPTDPDGHAWIRYSRHDPSRFVSAADVLEGRVDPQHITGKLVLVGLTGLALVDYPATPVDARVPGAEIHAQLIENMFDGDYLTRPRWAKTAEFLALGLLGLLLVLTTPRARPWMAITTAMLLAAVLGAGGAIAFRHGGLLLDTASPVTALLVVFIALMSATLAESERHRRRLRETLQLEREAAARIAGELEAARRVQTGMLPDAAQLAGGDARFEIAARMIPAREVGGDLYDFFKPSPAQLTFLVGDVSGKGLPASLFMAISKALCKSAALRGGSAVDRVLTEANAEIARDNPEFMFVTALLCSLDLDSGELRYANAGHEPPLLLRAAGGIERLEDAGGPPVCMIEGHAYAGARRQLSPGDVLFLFSDGVTEAMDREDRLYGRERLCRLLGHLGAATPCAGLLEAVRQDLRVFGAVEAKADDITMLALRWRGPVAAG